MYALPQAPEINHAVHASEQQPAALILNEYGLIGDCCREGEALFGYRRSELQLQHVSQLLPQLADVPLVSDGAFNPRLDFLCHCGHRFVVQCKDGNRFYAELNFVHLQYRDRTIVRLILRPASAEQSEAFRLPVMPETIPDL